MLPNTPTSPRPAHARWKSSSVLTQTVQKPSISSFVPAFQPQSRLKVPSVSKMANPTLSKALKFRTVTLVTTLGLTWLFTGNAATSVGLTLLQQSTNTAVYYFFEKNYQPKSKAAPIDVF